MHVETYLCICIHMWREASNQAEGARSSASVCRFLIC